MSRYIAKWINKKVKVTYNLKRREYNAKNIRNTNTSKLIDPVAITKQLHINTTGRFVFVILLFTILQLPPFSLSPRSAMLESPSPHEAWFDPLNKLCLIHFCIQTCPILHKSTCMVNNL